MSQNYETQEALMNVKRQAKRFASLLNVPLTDAQLLLAKHVYQQKSFAVLKSKIVDNDFSNRIFLSKVYSDCDDATLTNFANEIGELIESIQESVIAELYNGSTRELVFKTFDLKS